MRTVLGIDGGSSKTHALVVDESGCALGFGKAGIANHQVTGLEAAAQEIRQAARSALAGAGLAAVDEACFCLSGADLEEDYAMLRTAMESLGVAPSLTVKNDTMAALRAGLERSWGVVVIVGSGFNAAGRAPDGQEIVFPGLGAISGDWGGGGALGLEMIRQAMRARDGRGEPTRLIDKVLDALGATSLDQLLRDLYHGRVDRSQVLGLVPLLFQAAEEGDAVARKLIVDVGEEVGVSARALIRRLGLTGTDVEVILGGSVFKGQGSLLIDTVKNIVYEETPRAQIKRPCYEPVVGAALLGLEAMGVTVNEDLYDCLEQTLPPGLFIR